MKKIIIAVVCAGLIAAAFGGLYVCAVGSTVCEDTSFMVDTGASVGVVASQLKTDKLIISRNVFKILVAGFGGKIQAGIYDIKKGSSSWRIARMMSRGDVAFIPITIPEGYTAKQIVAVLEKNPNLTGDTCPPRREGVVRASGLGGASSEEINNNTNLNSDLKKPPLVADDAATLPPYGGETRLPDCGNIHDGELFPDTYRVAKGTPRAAVLSQMREHMNSVTDNLRQSAPSLPMPLKNWDEVIVLASIVQRETPRKSEMPIVASVYLNRLKIGMKLQADPTVVYAVTNKLGDMQGRALTRTHLKIDDACNTYVHYGLPPMPISNPGLDAINAVLNPTPTDYLYFVADGTGGHVFSKTLAEHEAHHEEWREIKKSQ